MRAKVCGKRTYWKMYYQILCILPILATTLVQGNQSTTVAPTGAPQTGAPANVDSDEMTNMEFLSKYDEISYSLACKYMQLSTPEDYKLNLSRPMSLQDVMKLTFLNKGRDLANPLAFGDDIQWRRNIVNVLFDIFRKSCPGLYVYKNYLKIMEEFVMIYLNSIEPRASNQSKLWKTLTNDLNTCRDKNKIVYKFTSEGMLAKNLLIPQNDDGGDPLTASISISEEIARNVFMMDPIVDSLWIVFSHAWSVCLPTIEARELWGPRFKELFYKEFLQPLAERWRDPGRVLEYMGLMVGDYDVPRMEYNMLSCLQAGYMTHNMEKVQLQRPVKVDEIHRGVRKFQNQRPIPIEPVDEIDDPFWFDFWFK